MCTTKGKACLRSVTVGDASPGSSHVDSPSTWNVCGAGSVLCSSVDGNENFALFGGCVILTLLNFASSLSIVELAGPFVEKCLSYLLFFEVWNAIFSFNQEGCRSKCVGS